MSKPNKPGELVNVEVEAISMVSKAANGEKFKIFKSADEEPEEVKSETNEVKKEAVKNSPLLTDGLKEVFAGEQVEKGEVADTFRNKQNMMHLNEAFYALRKVLKLDSDDTETDRTKIISALDDFRSVAGQILLGTETEPVIKAGRKVSGSRLEKLRDIQNLINEVLDGLEEPKDEVIDIADNTNAAGIQKAIADALKPLNDKVNNLNVEGVIKEALTPIITRIEKIENARGFSNRALESSAVEKNSSSFWDGAF